jgi:hypothetical protein
LPFHLQVTKLKKKTLIGKKVVFLRLGLCEFRVSSKQVHDPICLHLHCLTCANELIKRCSWMSFCPNIILWFSHTFLFQWMELRSMPWIFVSFHCFHFKELPLIHLGTSLGAHHLFTIGFFGYFICYKLKNACFIVFLIFSYVVAPS